MPEPDAASVAAAISRLLVDREMRERLGRAGIETAAEYAWSTDSTRWSISSRT